MNKWEILITVVLFVAYSFAMIFGGIVSATLVYFFGCVMVGWAIPQLARYIYKMVTKK